MCSRLHSAPSARDKAALKLVADVDPEKTAVKRLDIAGQRTGAVAAEHIGVADRVGSLETGKDADLVICKGSPMEISGVVKYVFINGELVE